MRPLFVRLLWLLAIGAVLVPLVTALQCAVLLFHNPANTAWMRLRVREAHAEGKTLEIKHHWLDFNVIPLAMKQAVVAAEDERFYQHHGFDWEAMKKALAGNDKSGKIHRGGSTITQQLAKNLFLSPSRSYWRKLREAFITANLELFLSKDRILELYLNSIEFGPGVFGVDAAAEYHFHTTARRLSLDQCCRLAAIIPSPRRYKIYGNYVSRRAATLQRIIAGQPPPVEEVEPDTTEEETSGPN